MAILEVVCYLVWLEVADGLKALMLYRGMKMANCCI